LNSNKNGKGIERYLQTIFDEIKNSFQYKHINYLIQAKILAPVQEEGITRHKLILTKENRYLSISEYFGFEVNNITKDRYSLHIFVKDPEELKMDKKNMEQQIHEQISSESLLSFINLE